MKKNKWFERIGFTLVCAFALFTLIAIVYAEHQAYMDRTGEYTEGTYIGNFLAEVILVPALWNLFLVYASMRYYLCETTHTTPRGIINISCLVIGLLMLCGGVLIIPLTLFSFSMIIFKIGSILSLCVLVLFFGSIVLRVSYWIYRATHRHLFDH